MNTVDNIKAGLEDALRYAEGDATEIQVTKVELSEEALSAIIDKRPTIVQETLGSSAGDPKP